jgi:hypothetical protein
MSVPHDALSQFGGWLIDNWPRLLEVLVGTVALLTAVNKLTPHHSLARVTKILLWVAEMGSLLTSKGVGTGILGQLKPPLVSVPPAIEDRRARIYEQLAEMRQQNDPDDEGWSSALHLAMLATVLAVMMLLMFTISLGCAASPKKAETAADAIVLASEAVQALHPIGAKVIHQQCLSLADRCREGDAKACSDGDACIATRKRYDAVVLQAHDALEAAGKLIQEWGGGKR